MPDTTPRTSPRSIALVIVGAVAALFAAGLIVAGGAILVADSTKDDHGYLSTSSHRFATGTAALATDNLDIDLDGVSDVVSSEHYGKVGLRVEPTSGKPVFVGIARTRDVDAYLGSVAHSTVTDINTDPFRVDQSDVTGRRRATPPARHDIWSASAHGDGTQTLTWGVQDGSWSIVVMNDDGSPGVHARVSAGARLPFLTALGWSTLGGGLHVLAGGVALIVAGSRPRPRAPRGTGEVGPAPVTA